MRHSANSLPSKAHGHWIEPSSSSLAKETPAKVGVTAAISTGLPSASETLSRAVSKLLTRWEMPHAHGMGIDSSGNIYVGRTKELRVDKYVRVH